MRFPRRAAVILGAAITTLGGCNCEHAGAPGGAASCDTPRDAITIALASLPNTLDWSRSNESSWQNYPVILAMMRGLTALDAKHEPVPDLAEKWEVENTKEGHQVWTFHLRPGVVWSDGKTPLTARDFVFAWRRAILGNEPANMDDLLGADAVESIRADTSIHPEAREAKLAEAVKKLGVEAVDDHTLRVTLRTPRSYFLSRVAYVYNFFPAPSADLENKSEKAIEDYFDEPANGKPMSLGAFRIDSWDRVGKTIRLVENEHDDAAPATGRVKQLTVIEAELSPLLYDQCKVDFIAMDDPSTLATAPADMARSELLSTYWLGMNTAALDLPLRQAISFALDRDALPRGLLPQSRPAFGFLPPDLPGSLGPGDPLAASFPHFDAAKARALLAKSKYDGHELTLLVKSGQTFMPETGLADAIRRQLEPFGIKVRLVTTSDFANDVKKADGTTRHDLFLKRIGADYAHPQTFLVEFTKNGNNYTGWEKLDGGAGVRELEALLDEGAAENDPAKMKETYTRAQSLLLDRYAVLVPIYYPDRYYRKRPWIEGLGFDPFNFLTFRSMRIAGATAEK